jgi:hypothetical protein
MRAARLRFVINLINLSTLLGLAVALAGRARVVRGPEALLLATGYQASFPAPNAPAVTIGNVVLLRMSLEQATSHPTLLRHEGRHATQYAWWIGPFGFLPAYLVASVWSWAHTRSFALRNAFEVRAGLVDGGYLPPPQPPEPGEPGQPVG